jgi:uncharacterized membrane protein YgcG
MLAFVALIGFAVASVADVPSPRPTGWVSDQARVLDREQRQQLDSVQIRNGNGEVVIQASELLP